MSLRRIHILGAPGSGVTTLGRALASQLGCAFFDTDDYYWFTNDPLPYRRKRNAQHRASLLRHDLEHASGHFVLAGALLGWEEGLGSPFDGIIYRWLPADIRLARIREREAMRYGPERIAPGGDLHQVYVKFLDWAAGYDTNSDNRRSRQAELAWFQAQKCFKLQLEADLPVEKLLEQVYAFVQ